MLINVTYFLFVVNVTNAFDVVNKIDIINNVNVTNEINAIVATKSNVKIMLKNVAKATTFNFKVFLIQYLNNEFSN